MSKLSKIAKKVVSLGNYVAIDDIAIRYPDGVEVNGIAMKAAKNQSNAIAFTFNDTANVDAETGEIVDAFFYAESGDLKKIVTAWLAEMTLDEIDAELKENPVKIKVYKMQTRNGRDYVKAHIIDDETDNA